MADAELWYARRVKRFAIIGTAVLLLSSCFSGFNPRESGDCPEIEALSDDEPILAIGDSTFAWRSKTCDTIPDVVALELGREVENVAVNGARVTGGEHAIQAQFHGSGWSWVLLTGGGNDLNNECECGVDCSDDIDRLISEDGRAGDIPRLIGRLLEESERVLLYGYYELGPDSNYGFDECLSEIDELRRRKAVVAEAFDGVTFVDGRDAVTLGREGAYAFDDVHPSKEGAQLVGELIAQRMIEVEATD